LTRIVGFENCDPVARSDRKAGKDAGLSVCADASFFAPQTFTDSAECCGRRGAGLSRVSRRQV